MSLVRTVAYQSPWWPLFVGYFIGVEFAIALVPWAWAARILVEREESK